MTQPLSPSMLNGLAPPAVDYVILGGRKTPGRAIVRGASSPRVWDKRKGYGITGATIVYTGDDLSEPVIEIYLFEPQHFADWDAFAKAVLEKPPSGTRPKALDIIHPYLNRSPWNIRSVVVTNVTGFEQDDQGGTQCEIQLEQFRAPKPILAKPVASTPKVDGKTPDALDAADIETNILRAQIGVVGVQIAATRGKG